MASCCVDWLLVSKGMSSLVTLAYSALQYIVFCKDKGDLQETEENSNDKQETRNMDAMYREELNNIKIAYEGKIATIKKENKEL